MPFPASFGSFAIALIFVNVRYYAAIPQHFACFPRIKAAIGIEVCSGVLETTTLQIIKDLLDCLFQVIRIMMMPRKDPCCRNNIPISVNYWQDIAGLGLLATLVGDTFAPFLATVWLPSRVSTDKFNSYLMDRIPASHRRCRLPSLLHLRKW